jgi:hypothetical protein
MIKEDRATEVRNAIINSIERLDSLICTECLAMNDFELHSLHVTLLINLNKLKNED